MRTVHVIYLFVLAVIILAAGCDMTSNDELHTAEEQTETAARVTSNLIISALDMGGSAEEFDSQNSRRISGLLPVVEGPDGDGVFTIEYHHTYYVSWLDEDETPIIGSGKDELGLLATIDKAKEDMYYFLVEVEFEGIDAPQHAPGIGEVVLIENNPVLVFEVNNTGDFLFLEGGTVVGTWYAEYEDGGYTEVEFKDLAFIAEPYGDKGHKYVADGGEAVGKTQIPDNSEVLTYDSEVCFDAGDGTGEGTMILRDSDYRADLFINTRHGSGHYEDNTGKHKF